MLNLKHLIDIHNSVTLAHLHSRWNASRWHWRLEDNQLYWKDVKPLRHWKWWDGAYGLVLDELKRNWAREETLAKRTSQFLIHHHNIFSQCSLRYIPSEQTIQCICNLPDIINSCIDTIEDKPCGHYSTSRTSRYAALCSPRASASSAHYRMWEMSSLHSPFTICIQYNTTLAKHRFEK